MSKVKIVAIISNPTMLHTASHKWMDLNPSVENKETNTLAVIGRDITFHGFSGGLVIDFDGGHKAEKGFSYTIVIKGGFAELIFKGDKEDYGFGDIRQILDGIEISQEVEITDLVITAMPWPSASKWSL
jgi:hypothetical protein